ncbi:BatD family protein [Frankia sp. RB7]|nr:BatD family protein [Frankia sp. RB7]
MRHWLAAIALLPAVALPSQDGRAQLPVTSEPTVQVTIDPPRVVVGQQATLHIVVLAPNYMTSPPELPDFQLRNAVTRQLQSVNTNEQRDGVFYAGVRFEYAIYPQEPGSYAVSDQKVHVKYAAEPPSTRELDIVLPRVSFEAFIPDAAAELQPFLSATRLNVEQTIRRSSDQLKPGDAVTRIVTIAAQGTPAMLLPPQPFADIDGLKLYPAQPDLADKTEGRTGVATSTRVDSATYMLERPGDYSLPAIDIGWWNVGNGKVERVHLDAVPLKVMADPASRGAAPIDGPDVSWTWNGLVDLVADHWLSVLVVTIVAVALGWFAPGMTRRTADYYRRRREVYLQSEAFAFDRLRRAVRHRDASTAYFALLDWLPHLEATSSRTTISAFKSVACDPALEGQIGAIEHELFATQHGSQRWSPHQLLRHITVARRRLRLRTHRRDSARLPQTLNPVGASKAPAHGGRRPAR